MGQTRETDFLKAQSGDSTCWLVSGHLQDSPYYIIFWLVQILMDKFFQTTQDFTIQGCACPD